MAARESTELLITANVMPKCILALARNRCRGLGRTAARPETRAALTASAGASATVNPTLDKE